MTLIQTLTLAIPITGCKHLTSLQGFDWVFFKDFLSETNPLSKIIIFLEWSLLIYCILYNVPKCSVSLKG